MTTLTIRVTSSAVNIDGTAFGSQSDVLTPSFWDLYVTGSADPNLPNGVYDAYCLNPTTSLSFSPRTATAAALDGESLASYATAGVGSGLAGPD